MQKDLSCEQELPEASFGTKYPLPIGLGVAAKFTSPVLEQPVLAALWL